MVSKLVEMNIKRDVATCTYHTKCTHKVLLNTYVHSNVAVESPFFNLATFKQFGTVVGRCSFVARQGTALVLYDCHIKMAV